jgi:hypothetical protein
MLDVKIFKKNCLQIYFFNHYLIIFFCIKLDLQVVLSFVPYCLNNLTNMKVLSVEDFFFLFQNINIHAT